VSLGGLNLAHYPKHVSRITTVDPNPGMNRLARRRRHGGKVVRVYEGIRLTDDAETRVQAWVQGGRPLSL
jgi:hypothetical protein